VLLTRIVLRAALAGALAAGLLSLFVRPLLRDAWQGRSAAMQALAEAAMWLIVLEIAFLEGLRTWRSARPARPTSSVPSVLLGGIVGILVGLCMIGIALGDSVEDWSQAERSVPVGVQIRILLILVGAAFLGGVEGYRRSRRHGQLAASFPLRNSSVEEEQNLLGCSLVQGDGKEHPAARCVDGACVG